MNNIDIKLFQKAETFYNLGKKEYVSGKKNDNDEKIRQGADKAWNASVQAVKALAANNRKNIPRSYKSQLFFLLNFESEYPEIVNGYPFMSISFKSFASRLHGECYYHGEYNIDELDSDMENVSQFLGWIKTKMTNNK